MPTIVWQTVKEPRHDNAVKAKIYNFLQKLGADDTSPGLHVEPMQQPLDTRVRTARVDLHWRAVLFRLDPSDGDRTYVYAGTWEHDEAIRRARTTTLSINPVNGVASFRQAAMEPLEPAVPVAPATPTVVEPVTQSLLRAAGYLITDLVGDFGFDEETARRAFDVLDEDALLMLADSLDNAWQGDVLVAMGAGTALHEIKQQLELIAPADIGIDGDADTGGDADARLLAAMKHPAAQMQFRFIAGDDHDELRRVIEGGDFAAWRIFLHPDQRRYAEQNTSGAFRISGGAGTGKTVVLLHRARYLARRNPQARIVLTTFTRALADTLRRDLERLDPGIRFAAHLGEPGVLVRGVDQLAHEVRQFVGDATFATASERVIGWAVPRTATPTGADWDAAIADAGSELPVALRSPAFFEGEYSQVILPNHIVGLDDYFRVRRPGRGVALNRARRAVVWQVIERMRRNARISGAVDFAEVAAIAAECLDDARTRLVDHVLVDEAQDLDPAKWQLLRSLVEEGPDDLFIADDTHQRIYGRPVVLARYGIQIRGRSRRLTLNYRTTLENLRYAMGILSGEAYVDLEADDVTTDGYRSARSGPVPAARAMSSDAAQLDAIAADLREWLDAGVAPETIAVLAASNNAARKVQQGLSQRGVSVALIAQPRTTGGQPVVMTMHVAKGMEFARVVMFDVSDGQFPPAAAYRNLPEEERADKDRQFRSLLYVAASRARDQLVVTWKGAPSRLLVSP